MHKRKADHVDQLCEQKSNIKSALLFFIKVEYSRSEHERNRKTNASKAVLLAF